MKSLILLLAYFSVFNVLAAHLTKYDKIFSFGDSLADTGNFLLSGALSFPVIQKLPYGKSYFQHATGRCSDGRLVVDFIAEAYGLPYLPPYLGLGRGEKIKHGVNFAVAGATAIDANFFYEQKIGHFLWTNDSLNVQLGWFKKLKPTLCITKQECENYFKKSLFLMGEIGGNDYNYPFFVGGTYNQLQAMVPQVVQTIVQAATIVIEEGAMNVMVPGNLPIGCNSVYLTLFQTANKSEYDLNGCLKKYNYFAKYHNNKLMLALQRLRRKYTHATIVYADYYGAAMPLFHAPRHLGFKNGGLISCCGGGGPYNFNNSARCGHVGSKACVDPKTYVNWDGAHLTEAANDHVAKSLIYGPFTSPSLN